MTNMETFTFGWKRTWWTRVAGRNRLVRPVVRIEALVSALAVFSMIMMAPVAAAIGTSVHEVRSQFYAGQADTRHQVTATAVGDAAVVTTPSAVKFIVPARWDAAGRRHEERIEWSDMAKAGENLAIWVDDRGERVDPPAPPSRADAEAIGAAAVVWLGFSCITGAGLTVLHRYFDRRRYADWDRQMRAEVGDDGDRRGRQT